MNERPFEDDEGENRGGDRVGRSRAGLGCGGEGDVSDGRRLSLEDGCIQVVGKEAADEHRRCSTLAR